MAKHEPAPSRNEGEQPVRRIVIKIGSAVLAPGGQVDLASFQRLADAIAAAKRTHTGLEVVVVSSGAVASGFRSLGLDAPPKDLSAKQAAAAVGQHKLMSSWARSLAVHEIDVAQLLYTADDLDARERFLNTRRTLLELLARGVVPIVNENDTVSFAEIKLGDNDRLSALTAGLVDADILLILSSVAGLLDASGAIVHVVEDVADARRLIRAEKSGVGTGGMESKLDAAATAAGWGITTVIASGRQPDVVRRVLAIEPGLGTRIAARPRGVRARRKWLEASARPKGVVHVDAGCARALVARGASLLPSGVVSVDGSFTRGAMVSIVGPDGAAIARGISAYASDELERIKGKKAGAIAGILGYTICDEVVHRDDLVLV